MKVRGSETCFTVKPHPRAPKRTPDSDGMIWPPEEAFATAFSQNTLAYERAVLAAVQRPMGAEVHHCSRRAPTLEGNSELVSGCRRRATEPAARLATRPWLGTSWISSFRFHVAIA